MSIDMNKLWNRVQDAVKTKKYLDHALNQGPAFVSGRTYLRIFIAEMYLEKSFAWFKKWYPAVNVGVRLEFGDQKAVIISRVVKPPENATKEGVLKNYKILDLTPFNGGTVEIQAALLAMQGANYLGTAIDVLQSFSGLVAPPFAAALTVAEKVSDGLDNMLEATNGNARLPYHDTFVGAAMGESQLKPGYVAIIRAEQGTGRDHVDAKRLSVVNGELWYEKDGSEKQQFREADYILLRIEQTDKRDDYDQLAAIKQAYDDFVDALEKGDPDAGKAAKRAMYFAILRSADIAKFDKRRTWENFEAELKQLESDFGYGAVGVRRKTLTEIINTGPTTMNQAVNLGELTLR
jgi:hypothetical protein